MAVVGQGRGDLRRGREAAAGERHQFTHESQGVEVAPDQGYVAADEAGTRGGGGEHLMTAPPSKGMRSRSVD